MDPAGRFIAVANYLNGVMTVLAVNATTGALLPSTPDQQVGQGREVFLFMRKPLLLYPKCLCHLLKTLFLLPLDVYGAGGGLPYIDGPSALCLHQGSVCNGHGERYVSDVFSLYSHKFSLKSMCMSRSG